jgi:hypothetical protein
MNRGRLSQPKGGSVCRPPLHEQEDTIMALQFDGNGRYLVVNEDGGKPVPHTRATTLARTLDDEHGLTKWRQRMVGVGLSKRDDLRAQIAACHPDERGRLDSLCRDAVEAAGASSSANLGSALHSFCQRIDEGEDLSIVPDTWRPDVEAYRAAMDEAGLTVELIERCCVIPELVVAGTLDRTVLEKSSGRHYVLDLKTGRSLDYSWPSISIQLSLYAHASTLYDAGTEQHSPMPDVDQETAIVAHLPAGTGTCEIYAVDLVKGWEGALTAHRVRTWRKETFNLGRIDIPRSPTTTTTPSRREWLVDEVKRIVGEHPDAGRALAQHWPIGVPTFKQSDSHTDEELQAIAQTCDEIGQRFRLPFSETPDPGPIPNKEKEMNRT